MPKVVDAGIEPSQAAEAIEMGADAGLINTAIAVAKDPAQMSRVFKLSVEAGRIALFQECSRDTASASSLTSFLN